MGDSGSVSKLSTESGQAQFPLAILESPLLECLDQAPDLLVVGATRDQGAGNLFCLGVLHPIDELLDELVRQDRIVRQNRQVSHCRRRHL